MQVLRFGYRDLFFAPRLAFSLQRMWIQFLGMGVGYLLYCFFAVLSLLTAGWPLPLIWRRFGLLPCLFPASESAPWYSWLLFSLASAALLICYLLSATAVARAAFASLKHVQYFSWRDAYAFAGRKVSSILLAPFSLFLLIGLTSGCFLISAWIGRLPVIGAPFIAVLTPLWILLALFILFSIMVAKISFWLTPGIIVTTEEDAFEAVFQSYSLLWTRPWRLFGYQLLGLVVSIGAMAIFALVLKSAVWIMNFLFSVFIGQKYVELSQNGQVLLQNWLAGGKVFFQALLGRYESLFYFSPESSMASSYELSAINNWYSCFYGLGLLLAIGGIISYGLATFSCCNLINFIVLHKCRAGENLLERNVVKDSDNNEQSWSK